MLAPTTEKRWCIISRMYRDYESRQTCILHHKWFEQRQYEIRWMVCINQCKNVDERRIHYLHTIDGEHKGNLVL